MITIKQTQDMGRGVFASQLIKKGTVILEVELIQLPKRDNKLIKQTLLNDYVYELPDKSWAIALGVGSLFNTSKEINTDYYFVKKGARFVIRYKVLTDIKKGQQLFIDYGWEPQK